MPACIDFFPYRLNKVQLRITEDRKESATCKSPMQVIMASSVCIQ